MTSFCQSPWWWCTNIECLWIQTQEDDAAFNTRHEHKHLSIEIALDKRLITGSFLHQAKWHHCRHMYISEWLVGQSLTFLCLAFLLKKGVCFVYFLHSWFLTSDTGIFGVCAIWREIEFVAKSEMAYLPTHLDKVSWSKKLTIFIKRKQNIACSHWLS